MQAPLDRRLSLGGSDAAAALGLSTYKSRVQLWLEKKGLAAPEDLDGNHAVYWGNRLEPLILDEYRRRTGNQFVGVNVPVQSTDYAWMTGTLDALAEGGRVVEAKTAGERSAHLWGPDGSDEMPREYLAQVAHYLAVTGLGVADVAVLIGGRDFRILSVRRDSLPIAGVVRQEEEFWRSVEGDEPPPAASSQDCRLLWPQDNGARLTADDELANAWVELVGIKRDLKDLEERKAAAEAFIQSRMRDRSELADEFGKLLVTWKTQAANRLDVDAFRKQHPKLAAEFTRRTQSRVFRLKGE